MKKDKRIDEFSVWAEDVSKNNNTLKTIDSLSVKCNAGEYVFFEEQSVLFEKRARYIKGGLYSKGCITHDFHPILRGVLIVTNKRILFTGEGETKTILISDIVSLKRFLDAVEIGVSSKTKNMRFSVANGLILWGVINYIQAASADGIDISRKGKIIDRYAEEKIKVDSLLRENKDSGILKETLLNELELYNCWYKELVRTGNMVVVDNTEEFSLYENEKIYFITSSAFLRKETNGEVDEESSKGSVLLSDLRLFFKNQKEEIEISIEDIIKVKRIAMGIEIITEDNSQGLQMNLVANRLICSALSYLNTNKIPKWLDMFNLEAGYTREIKKVSRLEILKNPINECYINSLQFAIDELMSYLKDLDNNLEVISLIDSVDGIDAAMKIEGFVLENRKLAYIALEDLLQTYAKLGYDESSYDTPEGLGLIIAVANLFGCRLEVEEMLSKERRAQYNDWVLDVLREIRSLLKIDTFIDNTILNYIFNTDSVFADYSRRYAVYMYRLMSIMAKVDGRISERESRCLASMMSLSSKKTARELMSSSNVLKPVERTASRAVSNRAAIDDLDVMIGLSSVKKEVRKLSNFISIQKAREQGGLKTSAMSYHCVLTGNPGTGKTSVARILARIFKEQGVLKKGHLIETDKSGLVAEFVGQTAAKTNQIIDKALDGVLFIDEAYSLVDGGQSDYGKEAVATLLKRMEDDRERLVVILAGYTEDMMRFLETNPGLKSRFNRYIEFPDYAEDELIAIFKLLLQANQYEITMAGEAQLEAVVSCALKGKDRHFGNGRYIRNLFEKTIENQANRLASIVPLTQEMLTKITDKDVSEN